MQLVQFVCCWVIVCSFSAYTVSALSIGSQVQHALVASGLVDNTPDSDCILERYPRRRFRTSLCGETKRVTYPLNPDHGNDDRKQMCLDELVEYTDNNMQGSGFTVVVDRPRQSVDCVLFTECSFDRLSFRKKKLSTTYLMRQCGGEAPSQPPTNTVPTPVPTTTTVGPTTPLPTNSPTHRPTPSPTREGQVIYSHEQKYPELVNSFRKPNIVMLLLDDAGVSDNGIPVYNQGVDNPVVQTPHLDALAAQGAVFHNAYASSPVCGPSRHAIMTGVSTFASYVKGNAGNQKDFELNDEHGTIFEVMKQAGYRVAYTGKWGFCTNPLSKSVDYFFGLISHNEAHAFYPDRMYELSSDNPRQMSDARNPRRPVTPNYRIQENANASPAKCIMDNPQDAPKCVHVENATMQKTMQVLRDFTAKGKLDEKPFFLLYSLFVPHVGAYSKNPADRQVLPVDFPKDCAASNPILQSKLAGKTPAEAQDECNFLTMMEDMFDSNLNTIVEFLEEQDIAENTLVVVASDNGPANNSLRNRAVHSPDTFPSNGQYNGYKREVYEGGIRVPLVMRWKSVIEPGTAIDTLTSLPDLYNTFAHLAGAASDEDVINILSPESDGLSLLPSIVPHLIRGESPQLDHEYLGHVFCRPYNPSNAQDDFENDMCTWAVRKGDYKLIHDPFLEDPSIPKLRLFNVGDNPVEDVSTDVMDESNRNQMENLERQILEDIYISDYKAFREVFHRARFCS